MLPHTFLPMNYMLPTFLNKQTVLKRSQILKAPKKKRLIEEKKLKFTTHEWDRLAREKSARER